MLTAFVMIKMFDLHANESSFILSINALSLSAKKSKYFFSENIDYPVVVMINIKC